MSTSAHSQWMHTCRYGFVTYVNKADAEKAISTLDKSEIAGRQINVEAAKPPTAQTPRAPRAAAEPRAPVIGEDGEVIESVAPRKRKPRTKAARGVSFVVRLDVQQLLSSYNMTENKMITTLVLMLKFL